MGQLGEGPCPPGSALAAPFEAATEAFGLERTLTYGRLPGGLVMLNWPLQGNDWHLGLAAAFQPGSPDYGELMAAMRAHSEAFLEGFINATDGSDYDLAKGTQKDALFCGLPTDELVALQDALLAGGVYPERVELGSVAVLGALADYLAGTKAKTPTLMLEVGMESTQSYIVTPAGVEASRPIALGLDSMVPVVQKELGLKDEDAARRLFYSKTFDFTGMGALLVKRLVKELQSSIGFYEVQTGQSVGQVVCTQLMPKLEWLESAIATGLGISSLRIEPAGWLMNRQITLADSVAKSVQETRWFGLLSLMVRYNIDHALPAEEKK
jgi:hypothetical protein